MSYLAVEMALVIWFLINYIYEHPARAGYDTRSIFKQCLIGLNSEFSFS